MMARPDCADFETGIRAATRPRERRRGDPALHRRRHLDRMRHPGLPFPRRAVDQVPADPVRCVHGERADAPGVVAAPLRHGCPVFHSPAGPRPLGAGQPPPGRQNSRRDHTEHRQPASSLRLSPETWSWSCTATRPMPPASIAGSATTRLGPRALRGGRRARRTAPAAAAWSRPRRSRSARRCRRRRCAGPKNSPAHATCSSRSALRWWSGRPPDFRLLAKRNGARLVILNRDPTEFDDIADLVIRADIGATLEPFIAH